jgi:DNA-binding LacI/PurR family transcriptional regulator
VITQQKTRRDATLKDVAKLAGVSTATIARVLHNNGYVAEETRRVVEEAIAQSGYRVNAVAQGLRRQRTFVLGHILQSIAPNPFFASVALSVQQEAARFGCGVILVNTQGEAAVERNAVETLIRQRVEAILFTTVTDESNVRLAAAAGLPVVQVERVGTASTHAVSVDNHRGAFDAVDHLATLGHERIAFIGFDPNLPIEGDLHPAITDAVERRSVERERIAGYRDAMAAHRLPVPASLVDLGDTYYSPERGRAVTKRLLAMNQDERPTAIFAACDLLAAGVLQELQEQGLRVPDDFSVIGFDNTVSAHLAPPLTTVAQPMLELGQIAVRLALAPLEDGGNADLMRHERLTTHLIVRSSTGPPLGVKKPATRPTNDIHRRSTTAH